MASSDHRAAASSASSASSRFAVSQRRLAVGVPEPGRQLPEVPAEGVAVLPEQQHPVLVVERHDRDRALVDDDLPDAVPAAGHRDGVPAQRDDPPLVHRLAVQHAVLVRRRGVGHQMPTFSASSIGTGSRAASW